MRIAFKEWAVVCRALAAGRQALILRKGGTAEEGGEFRPDHREFLLFPTNFHQEPGAVIAEARAWVEPPPAGKFVVTHWAAATDVFRVDSRDGLRALRPFHVWSDPVVEERFSRDGSLYAMLLRVHVLPAAVTLEMRDAYGGCKSWVTLDEDVPAADARPVLDDAAFDRMRAAVTSAHSAGHTKR